MSVDRHVVLDDFGLSLGKTSERLVIRRNGEVLDEVPFRDVEQITVASKGVTMSTDMLYECAKFGVRVNLLTHVGQPYAQITSPNLTGTAATRRAQLEGFHDGRGALLAAGFAAGKVQNQINLLKYFAKYRRQTRPEFYNDVVESTAKMAGLVEEIHAVDGPLEDIRNTLMSLEGQAAKHYWHLVTELLPDRAQFTGRTGRGATDPVNIMLNYGYGILYNECWAAAALAGLDPFAGFLHADRPGKQSLVLDLIEEFRQPIVDRAIFAAVNRKYLPRQTEGRLSPESASKIARFVLKRLNAKARTNRRKKYRLKNIIRMQAQAVASFLRGDTKEPYRPFVSSW